MEGIANLGGTCAINSILQIIIRNNNLRSVILQSTAPENSLTNELKEIIDLIYNKKISISPQKFINKFFEIFIGVFNKFEEIDINELWIYIYNKIFEETSIIIPITSVIDKHSYDLYIHNNKKISDLTNIVQGSFVNIIECCNCKNITFSYEPFISMSLDIYENQSIANLIMNSLIREEREADDWKCDRCKQKCRYVKMKRIWKLPKVLFITLNRFNETYQKNNLEIFINSELNFNPDSIETADKNQIYNLQGLGLHYGNLMGGHYKALCEFDNSFYLYNDHIVNKLKKEDIYEEIKSNNSAYLIVYELEGLN